MATFEQQALLAYARMLKESAALSRLEALEAEVCALKAKITELATRKRGRPRKVANG